MSSLSGRTILITRAREQSGNLGSLIEQLGGTVIEAPVIGFEDPLDWGPVDASIRALDSYDRIILTSANAAERFHARIASHERHVPPKCRLVAIGPATAERIRSLGLKVDAIAADSRAEGVLALLLSEGSIKGQRILIPRAETARELLPDSLRDAGALVDVVSVYRTVARKVAPEIRKLLESGGVDVVTLTSSSTVTSLVAATGGIGALDRSVIAVIGPVTETVARDAGLTPRIVSPSPGMEAFALAIADYFEKRS